MIPPLPQRLRAHAASLSDERVTLHEIALAHGPAARGAMLVLLAIPCMLPVPGSGTVLAMGIAALAWNMRSCRAGSGLPERVARLSLPLSAARRTMACLVWLYEAAARFARARWSAVADERRHNWMAPVVALMALLIFLPIPFGNVLPSVALVLLGLGLMFRDGLALVLGAGVALSALGVTLALAALAMELGAAALQQLPPG